MTYDLILDILKNKGIPTFDLKAPAQYTEAVVGHVYAPRTLNGDDCVILRIDRVQLDVLWKSSSMDFFNLVCDTLDDLYIVYDIVDVSFDEDYLAMRGILQLEAV